MSAIADRIRALLDERGVRYETLHHSHDWTAQEAARDTHTPGRRFAKAVVMRVGDDHLMAVLPAHHVVDFERLSFALGGRAAELASEEEVLALCPDCEPGAVPPFGNLYGMPVIVSPELAKADQITCVAGGHRDALRIAWADYEALVEPRCAEISVPAPQPGEPPGSSPHA